MGAGVMWSYLWTDRSLSEVEGRPSSIEWPQGMCLMSDARGGGGGATTTGPDAAPSPAIYQNLRGGRGSHTKDPSDSDSAQKLRKRVKTNCVSH